MIFLHILIIEIENNNVHFNDHQKGFLLKQKVYMTPKVAGVLAGAVIWRAGAVGDAICMTATVACDWAGAVMQKPLAKRRKRRKSRRYTD